jgi:protein CpxP
MKKLTVAILAIAVTAIGAAFALAQTGGKEGPGKRGFGHHGKFGKRGGGMMEGRLFRQLDLTDTQKEQLKAIRTAAREESNGLRQRMMENHRKLAELGTDGVFDQAAVEAIASQQAEVHKQMIIRRANVKAQMFAILTPEQKTKFNELKETFKARAQERQEKRKARFGEKKADQ